MAKRSSKGPGIGDFLPSGRSPLAFVSAIAGSLVSCIGTSGDPVSCTDADVLPVMFGNYPGGPVDRGEAFMWLRGKGWFRIDDGCDFTMWYGDTFEGVGLDTAVSKPRAGVLSEDAWADMSVALEVSTWRDLDASDLEGGSSELHQGEVVFISGDHQVGCSACNDRGERLHSAAYDALEELEALGEPIDGERATLATVENTRELLVEDGLWSFEWTFAQAPDQLQLPSNPEYGVSGLALEGDDLETAFATRDDYLARDGNVYSKTQNKIATIVDDVAYEVWIRDEWPSWP